MALRARLAIAVHGSGVLANFSAEQLEAVDPAPVEAVRLTDAGRPATEVDLTGAVLCLVGVAVIMSVPRPGTSG